VVLDASLSQQAQHEHVTLLADAMRARLGLQVNLWVPVWGVAAGGDRRGTGV
jgi:hypothetical protein